MATSTQSGTPASRTYRPRQFAVLPGSAVRGGILAFFFMAVPAPLYEAVKAGTEGTDLHSSVVAVEETIGYAGMTAFGFMFAIGFTLFLAWLGYRRRVYEVGPDGITERRGILLRSERVLGYDDFEGVTVTKSRLQSMYNAGTVRLTDVSKEGEEQVTMKLSFIQNPEEVSTNILRHLTDVTGATSGKLETEDVDEFRVKSASVSHLSGSRLAASTGFRYLMPSGILEPRPGEAAKYGAMVGFGCALFGAAILVYFRDAIIGLTNLPNEVYYYAIIGIVTVALTVLTSIWFYWLHDRIQYELYEDHITVIEGDKTSSFPLHDIDNLRVHNRGLAALKGSGFAVLPWNDVGHISLRDENGDELVEFRYISNSETVFDSLEDWLVDHADEGAPEQIPDGKS